MFQTKFTPEFWRQRAAETRARAEQMADPWDRAARLHVATAYEHMAEIEERLADKTPHIASRTVVGLAVAAQYLALLAA